jgi:cohesin complex subunit SA-1/2
MSDDDEDDDAESDEDHPAPRSRKSAQTGRAKKPSLKKPKINVTNPRDQPTRPVFLPGPRNLSELKPETRAPGSLVGPPLSNHCSFSLLTPR